MPKRPLKPSGVAAGDRMCGISPKLQLISERGVLGGTALPSGWAVDIDVADAVAGDAAVVADAYESVHDTDFEMFRFWFGWC